MPNSAIISGSNRGDNPSAILSVRDHKFGTPDHDIPEQRRMAACDKATTDHQLYLCTRVPQ